MLLAFVLIVIGLATHHLRCAPGQRAPSAIDLAGALLAASGLATALAGVGRLLSDKFF